MAYQNFPGNFVQTHTANAGYGARKVPTNYVLVQTQALENHGTLVRLQGGDSHLGEDLEQLSVNCLDVVPV